MPETAARKAPAADNADGEARRRGAGLAAAAVMRATLAAALLLLLTADVRAQGQAPAGDAPAAQRPASSDRVAVPEPSEQAKAYYRSGNVVWVIDTAWTLPAAPTGTGPGGAAATTGTPAPASAGAAEPGTAVDG